MKKILFTATMLVCFSALSQAQTTGRVGINTTTPAATLDITAATADATRPDALLVPRMTRAQLEAKNAAYIADQNGALAFVTDVTGGTGTGKTVNVTATGFYYYDAPNSVWKGIGGGAVANPALNVTNQSASYTALATDDIILYTANTPGITLTLPTTGLTVGKRYYVSVIGNNDVQLSPAPRETANQYLITGQSNILMYTGNPGSPWSMISGY